MILTFAFFTFLNAFWIMMFIAIPFFTKYVEEGEESKPAIEGYIAAPRIIYWKKLIITSVILATLVTLALAVIIKSGIVPVKDLI